jgi:serine/threonine protein kinase/tetratricopeptide (TPR) repeat protein
MAVPMHGPASRRRFRIQRELGTGGMGVVYEAFDADRQARVAIKTLRQLTPDSLARFKREFRALQDVHHPNLVRLGELIAEENEWFFTMELVEGEDFFSFVRPTDPRRQTFQQMATKSVSSDDVFALSTSPFARGEEVAATANGFDEARLRSCMRQLASALESMHDAGMVHRDVKPSNIRVEPTGRLVLLDFGLVTELDGRGGSTGHGIVGTPAYMAPEQARATAVGPEADLYAVGVLLFEALTGRVPFPGTGIEILMSKQEEDAGRAAEEAEGIPPDLDDLCARLLRRDPAQRPTAAQLVRMLAPLPERRSTRPAPPPQPAPFVGRANELAALRKAHEEVREGATVTVLIHGESGVGKSALVRELVDALASDRKTCVLSGRCYEREAVPYKAFDGVVDALTRFLMRIPTHDVKTILPTKPGPLVQVFPVLRRVAAIAQLTTQPVPPMDPQELRERAFAALRDLLTRLAAEHTVVIAIDDVQWADADSVALLTDVLRPPEAPSLLFLGTVRTGGGPAGTMPAGPHEELIRDLPSSIPGDVRVIVLERLPYEEACELATNLLTRAGASPTASAAWIAEEADGHPLFIDALTRYSVLGDGAQLAVHQQRAVRLDDALAAPIQRLDAAERRVLDLLAMSGRPVQQEVLAMAAELDGDSFARCIAQLRFALLATTTGIRGSDTVELYHDRIRVAVKQKIPRSARPELHQLLATAMESCGSADAQALALHWYGAGDEKQAARYATTAAEQATQALAFDRAATLYDWALRLKVGTEEERAELYERLGDALASAGRGAPAASAFRRAAKKGNESRALDLHRRAADQLLRAGHFDDGLAAMRHVLAAIGMKLPSTPLTTLMTFLFWLGYLRVRGLGFKRRDTSHIAPHELTRIDTCWSVAFSLSITDTLRGATFELRTLALALEAGEIHRVARATALHAGYQASIAGRRGWARVERLLALAHSLAGEAGDKHSIGWAHGAHAIAHYTNGHFVSAMHHLREADRHWRETPGCAWELDTFKMFMVNNLAQLGRLREMCALAPKYLRETLERGDLYGAVNLRVGYANLRWLVADRADEAQRELDEAMAQWSKQGVHLEHFYELLARTNIALYTGAYAEGRARVDARWAPLQKALLFRVTSIRILARFMRARLALADGSTVMIARAEADARAIAREKMEWSRPIVDLLLAACDHARGSTGRSIAGLRAALAGFEKADMALHAACVRGRLGALLDDDEGRALAAAAGAWMEAEGVAAPARIVAMMAPGFTRR